MESKGGRESLDLSGAKNFPQSHSVQRGGEGGEGGQKSRGKRIFS